MFRAMRARGHFVIGPDQIDLSPVGERFVTDLGIDLAQLPPSRSPMCRECLDWSMRQSHLAGRLGRALLARFEQLHWMRRMPESRALIVSPEGNRQFDTLFR